MDGELRVTRLCEHGEALSHWLGEGETSKQVRHVQYGRVCVDQESVTLKTDQAIWMPNTWYVINVKDIIETALDEANIRSAS